jgi:hypothetical protein
MKGRQMWEVILNIYSLMKKTLEAKGHMLECDRKEFVGLAFRVGPCSGV